ncbi:MAG: sulfite exporter TauE/SafE family protein [Bacteroidales bacterium]|nr:sulfite exporter TauE/SafE family protein [Bacteroidales bacterium]
MDWIHHLLSGSHLPILSAFLLGILTSISPCPLATNITAIAFISKDIENRKRVFYNGLTYMLGGAISYSAIGILFYLGANKFLIASFLQRYGGRIIGPLLIVIGLFMFDFIKINLPFSEKLSDRVSESYRSKGFWRALLLGFVFALAFCPYTGVLYFGMLIPMTISSASGLYLPVIFAIGTSLPVVIIAYLIAYTLSGVGSFYNRIKVFEFWVRRVFAMVFIATGVYYIFQFV